MDEDVDPRPLNSKAKTPEDAAGTAHGKTGGHKDGGSRGKSGSRDKASGEPGVGSGRRLTPTARALAVAAVQGISTAFLDSVIKDDAIAREWLRKDANRWLKNNGQLNSKSTLNA